MHFLHPTQSLEEHAPDLLPRVLIIGYAMKATFLLQCYYITNSVLLYGYQ